MSTALGIAAALRAVARLIDEAVAAANLAMFQATTTMALSPELVDGGTVGAPKPQLNLFAYHIGQTAASRNQGLPARDASGLPIDRPDLTLEIHILLSAHSTANWQAESLLGIAMRALHDEAMLSRDRIRALLTPPAGASDALVLALSNARIAEQFERLRITPLNLSPQDIQQLWTALPGRYRPSVAYALSAVTIDSAITPRGGLPVQRVASAVVPFVRPEITAIVPQIVPFDAGGTVVTLRGSQLALPGALVRFSDGSRVAPQPDATDFALAVRLPTTLPAGIATATIVQPVAIGAAPAKEVNASNSVAFMLQPIFALAGGAPDITVLAAAGDVPRRLRIRLVPQPGATQEIELVLNDAADPAGAGETLPAALQPDGAIVASLTGLAAGTRIVRVRVDGAETPLVTDAMGRFSGPTVAL